MFSRLIRPFAYFGPFTLFMLVLAGIYYFRPEPPIISIPELPYWNFSAPVSLEQQNARKQSPEHAPIRDPFNSETDFQVLAASSLPLPKVTMIITGGRRPCCIINRKLYHPGEKAPGFTVNTIGATWVEITMDNNSTMRLFLKRSYEGVIQK